MSGLANKTPNSANVARINTTPVKSPNQKIAYVGTMTAILSVMLSTQLPENTYSYVFLAVGTTLIAGGFVNGDGPPTEKTNSIYWTACMRWAPTARVLDHLFDHKQEKEGIYHVMIGTRKCHLIDLATVDLPFFSTVSSNLFDVSTFMVDAGGQAFASWRGKLLKAIEAHVDTSPGVPISEALSACFVFVLFHAAIVRGDSYKSSKCIKSIKCATALLPACFPARPSPPPLTMMPAPPRCRAQRHPQQNQELGRHLCLHCMRQVRNCRPQWRVYLRRGRRRAAPARLR